jgi:hypothetical protein
MTQPNSVKTIDVIDASGKKVGTVDLPRRSTFRPTFR